MCDICRQFICPSACPNAEPKRSGMTCFYCGEDILVGEEYLASEAGNKVHAECFDSMDRQEMFRFFGEEDKICVAEDQYEF